MTPNDLAGIEKASSTTQREARVNGGRGRPSSGGLSRSSTAGVAETMVMAGRAEEALALVHALMLRPHRDQAAQLLRIRGIALAQLGHVQEAVAVLESALQDARHDGQELEVACVLDALGRLHALDGRQTGRHRERDAILRRHGIRSLPAPPLPPLPAHSF